MSKSYRRRNRIEGQFAPRLIEMLESPAYAALSLYGHRMVARIEIELAHHGGMDNGKLPITFRQFVNYGIPKRWVARTIQELTALGFAEVTEPGRAGNAEWRKPNLFRVTYRHCDRAPPTNEWRHITDDDARMFATAARRQGSNSVFAGAYSPRNGRKLISQGIQCEPQVGVTVGTSNQHFQSSHCNPTRQGSHCDPTLDTFGVVAGEAADVSSEERPTPGPRSVVLWPLRRRLMASASVASICVGGAPSRA
jgi:hypothetical protein